MCQHQNIDINLHAHWCIFVREKERKTDKNTKTGDLLVSYAEWRYTYCARIISQQGTNK